MTWKFWKWKVNELWRVRIRWLLFGCLLGEFLMLPTTLWLMKTPRIDAIVISEDLYQSILPHKYLIKNVRGKLTRKTKLTIIIANQEDVQREHDKRFGPLGDREILGFYDKNTHEVWTVNSPDVLAHEMRHVFEGYFHR